ncbi:hypothetical protein QCA50_002098 [Cerrena zonata]|uniref:Glucose receptor Git3 N-terminal domain-containing protein n=1 Tax=Cerrena zonata TaxID=2478898 RepID=A0AAW0GUM3_9APHY
MDPQPDSGGSSNTCSTPDPFDFSTRLGLTFITEASVFSAVAVLALLLHIIYSAATIKHGAARHWSTATHVHWYFLSLLTSELIQAVGGIINVRWIKDATVTNGPMCTAQGALKQVGDVGVALA